MKVIESYFNIGKKHINFVLESEKENIIKTAEIMSECMLGNGIVQLFGLKHSFSFSMELGYRAGGLMPFHQFNVNDLVFRKLIKEEALYKKDFDDDISTAHKLWDIYRIEKEDMFILVSDDGCEGIIIETAIIAKEKGHKIIAILSKKACLEEVSRHPSGKKLDYFADLVIDTHVEKQDFALKDSKGREICQLETLSKNTIAQCLTAECYRIFDSKKEECPILLSSNLEGADAHNRALSDKYLGRWNS